jgi:hypothetical protein
VPTSRGRGRTRRDRHGRGLRADLIPVGLPGHRSRAQRFDDTVLEAVERLEERWSEALAEVEFGVEEVPLELPATPSGADGALTADVDDDPVPLASTTPALTQGAQPHPARIVLYRRPLEARAHDPLDLLDLVFDVLVHEVASLLGLDPAVVDPEGHGEGEE